MPLMLVPGQPADWSSTYPGAAGSVRCGRDQPRGTSTSVVPFSGAESATKLKVKSFVVPAPTRIGATVIFPTPERITAPAAATSTSSATAAHSAICPARVNRRGAIDPARVYLHWFRMKLRDLPSVDELARDERLAAEPPALAVAAARAALARAREEIEAGHDPGDLVERALAELAAARAPALRRTLNATGVIVHTNLGRAPLAEAALSRALEVGRGYSNLEYDLAAGGRGSRQDHVAGILRRLTGAEAALVVNNNAAAVLLALAALAEGREVLVSRGELIEIGDGFRIPDVLARSGARLREVGTTNRTRAADYERAIGPDTALLLRVHQSNFRVVGFAEQPSTAELAAVAQRAGLPLVDDLGSGALDPSNSLLLAEEPSPRSALSAGADLACFSGDKLLGGPQAGIVVGRADLVERLRRHPLQRALRADKLTLAALEG